MAAKSAGSGYSTKPVKSGEAYVSDPMDKLLAALLRQAKAMNACTEAMNALAASNERLADAILAGEPEQGDGEEAQGVDMAGNRVVPS